MSCIFPPKSVHPTPGHIGGSVRFKSSPGPESTKPLDNSVSQGSPFLCGVGNQWGATWLGRGRWLTAPPSETSLSCYKPWLDLVLKGRVLLIFWSRPFEWMNWECICELKCLLMESKQKIQLTSPCFNPGPSKGWLLLSRCKKRVRNVSELLYEYTHPWLLGHSHLLSVHHNGPCLLVKWRHRWQ